MVHLLGVSQQQPHMEAHVAMQQGRHSPWRQPLPGLGNASEEEGGAVALLHEDPWRLIDTPWETAKPPPT